MLVAGDAGIGKTRLAAEAADRARRLGFRVAWGVCAEAEVSAPFEPWVQALVALDVGTPAHEPSVPQLLGTEGVRGGETSAGGEAFPEHDPEIARALLFSSVASHVAAVARDRPVLCVLEDLHWVDLPSARLLLHLTSMLRTAPVVVVGTYRDTEVGPGSPLAAVLPALGRQALVLHLDGLAAPQIGELVGAVTGRAVDARVVEALHRHTSGNPLFARELARVLDERTELDEFGGPGMPGSVGVPEGVRDVVRHCLTALPEVTRRVLEVAAATGVEFRTDVIEQVTGLERVDLLRALGEAEAARLVVERGVGRFAFRHGLLRDGVYDGLDVPRRVRLHGDIGSVLERLRRRGAAVRLAELAYHFLQAAPGGDAAAAVRYAVLAGDDAMVKLAYEDAADIYRQALSALELVPGATDRGEVLLRLGEAATAAGDLPRARQVYRNAAEVARTNQRPDQLARAALGLGSGPAGFEVALFERDQVTLLEDALAALPAEPNVLRARVLSRLSVALTYEAPLEHRRELAESAVAMAREIGDRPALAYALAAHCDAIAGPDDCERRLAEATEILALAEEFRDQGMELLARRLRLIAHLEMGDLGSAEREIEAYARSADRLRQPLYSWYAPLWRGMRALMDGRFSEVDRYRAEAAAIGEQAHSRNATLLTTVQEWVTLRRQGRFDEALSLIEDVMRRFGDTLPAVQIGRALVLAELGRRDEARVVLDRVTGLLDTLPKDAEWLPMLAEYADTVAHLDGHPIAEQLHEMLVPYRHRCIVNGIGAAWYGPVEQYLDLLAATMRRAAPEAAVGGNVFMREGDFWTLGYAGRVIRLKDSKGLRDIAQLLAAPGRETHVLDLAGAPESPRNGHAGEVLDPIARQQYRARLAELEEEITDAEALHDAGRVDRAREEREFLAAELAGALGLGGRPRRAGDPVERARSTVTRRIHDAVGRIERAHRELGRHLRRSVRTGAFCSYQPEEPVSWKLTA